MRFFISFCIIDTNLISVIFLQLTETQGQKRTNLVQQAIVEVFYEFAVDLNKQLCNQKKNAALRMV